MGLWTMELQKDRFKKNSLELYKRLNTFRNNALANNFDLFITKLNPFRLNHHGYRDRSFFNYNYLL